MYGKFNENTYNRLVELCVNISRRYNLNVNAIMRLYDVREKSVHIIMFKIYKNGASKLGQTNTVIEDRWSDEEVINYKNKSTKETIYVDTVLTKVIGIFCLLMKNVIVSESLKQTKGKI